MPSAMKPARLDVEGLSLSFGGLKAINDVAFSVEPGSITALIGPNGAGKTSMFNCISGFYKPQQGSIRFDGEDVTRTHPPERAKMGFARTFQNIALFRGMTVLDNIKLGRHAHMRTNLLQALAFFGPAAREEVEALNADLEARVDERTEELVRANEEIQRFAYIVTHDLRAPLVNIMGFTRELDETMESIQKYVMAEGETLEEHEIHAARQAANEDLPEAIGFIRSSTKKMDGLINAILKISRDGRRPLKPESIDLKELLQATADSIAHQVAETEGEITIEIDLPPIMSDRLSLDQIFGNLLDNAVKYRAKDKPLHISLTSRRLPGRRFAVDVTDNGRGIAAKDHQRVFDLFRRSGAQDQPGEGIGLAHVRNLARGLGGDISLTSEEGQGSTFTVTLPEDSRTAIRSRTS